MSNTYLTAARFDQRASTHVYLFTPLYFADAHHDEMILRIKSLRRANALREHVVFFIDVLCYLPLESRVLCRYNDTVMLLYVARLARHLEI